MNLENFCQIKTAYLLDYRHDKLTEAVVDEEIFSVFFEYADEQKSLEFGWDLVETGISGAAGFILIFETDECHGKSAYVYLDDYINKVETWLSDI